MSNQVLSFFTTAFLAIAVASSAAAEGPVVITRASVLKGGVTPGDSPGFPIEVRRSGVYRLAENLSVPNNRDGIIVYVPHVTINLGDFEMRGAKNAVVGSKDFLTVRRGRITGAAAGGIVNTSASGGGSFWRIEGVKIFGTPVAVSTGPSGAGLIVRNSVVGENNVGIVCGSYCHIEANEIRLNSGAGITIGSGTVLGNTIRGNSIGIQGNAASPAGFGKNVIWHNGKQAENVIPMTPNACIPSC